MPIKLTGPEGKVRGIVTRSCVTGADGFIIRYYPNLEKVLYTCLTLEPSIILIFYLQRFEASSTAAVKPVNEKVSSVFVPLEDLPVSVAFAPRFMA